MKLVDIKTFRERHFDPACAPSERTLRYLCERQELPARRLGRKWMIDEDEWQEGSDEALLERIRSA